MEKDYFFIFVDCPNLSAYSDGKLGYRFESQQEMNQWLTEYHRFNRETFSSLPMYDLQMTDMILNQLYQTEKLCNYSCCSMHVMRTKNPGVQYSSNHEYMVPVNNEMFDKIFS